MSYTSYIKRVLSCDFQITSENDIGWLFFGVYKNILPEMLTILQASRATYSCIPEKEPSNTILIISHTQRVSLDPYLVCKNQGATLFLIDLWVILCNRTNNIDGAEAVRLAHNAILVSRMHLATIALLCKQITCGIFTNQHFIYILCMFSTNNYLSHKKTYNSKYMKWYMCDIYFTY